MFGNKKLSYFPTNEQLKSHYIKLNNKKKHYLNKQHDYSFKEMKTVINDLAELTQTILVIMAPWPIDALSQVQLIYEDIGHYLGFLTKNYLILYDRYAKKINDKQKQEILDLVKEYLDGYKNFFIEYRRKFFDSNDITLLPLTLINSDQYIDPAIAIPSFETKLHELSNQLSNQLLNNKVNVINADPQPQSPTQADENKPVKKKKKKKKKKSVKPNEINQVNSSENGNDQANYAREKEQINQAANEYVLWRKACEEIKNKYQTNILRENNQTVFGSARRLTRSLSSGSPDLAEIYCKQKITRQYGR